MSWIFSITLSPELIQCFGRVTTAKRLDFERGNIPRDFGACPLDTLKVSINTESYVCRIQYLTADVRVQFSLMTWFSESLLHPTAASCVWKAHMREIGFLK